MKGVKNMGHIVLNDGRIISLTSEQSDRLNIVIMMTNDLDKNIKVGHHIFSLNQILTDPEEIQRISQLKMFDIPAIPIKSKKKTKVDQLS